MEEKSKKFTKFVLRFSITHRVTYIVFGLFFMMISNYFNVFAQDPLFSVVMKSSESCLLGCSLDSACEGGLLATAIYPTQLFLKRGTGG